LFFSIQLEAMNVSLEKKKKLSRFLRTEKHRKSIERFNPCD